MPWLIAVSSPLVESATKQIGKMPLFVHVIHNRFVVMISPSWRNRDILLMFGILGTAHSVERSFLFWKTACLFFECKFTVNCIRLTTVKNEMHIVKMITSNYMTAVHYYEQNERIHSQLIKSTIPSRRRNLNSYWIVELKWEKERQTGSGGAAPFYFVERKQEQRLFRNSFGRHLSKS